MATDLAALTANVRSGTAAMLASKRRMERLLEERSHVVGGQTIRQNAQKAADEGGVLVELQSLGDRSKD